MYPEIDIGNLTLSTYSILYALAYFVSSCVFWIELKRRGENFKIFMLISLTMLLSGFGGAKVFYILINVSLRDFLEDPVNTMISSGRIYHGGFIFSVLIAFLVVRLIKRNFWRIMNSNPIIPLKRKKKGRQKSLKTRFAEKKKGEKREKRRQANYNFKNEDDF